MQSIYVFLCIFRPDLDCVVTIDPLAVSDFFSVVSVVDVMLPLDGGFLPLPAP